MCKFKKKKEKSALLIIAILITTTINGCSKKQIDYGEESEDNVSLAKGPMGTLLSIPSSYEQEFVLDGDSTVTIKMEDHEIQVPQTENMYIVSYNRQVYDSKYHEFVVISLFDQGQEVYTEDSEHDYIGKVEENLSFYQKMLEEAQDAGDLEWIEYWQTFVTEAEEAYHQASAERPMITDYEGWDFIGSMNGKEADLFFAEGNINYSGFTVESYRYVTLIDYRPSAKGSQVVMHASDDKELDWNMCELSLEDAISEGENIFAELNLNNLICSGIYNLYWEYYGYAFGDPYIEYDGYYVTYQRGIAGEPIYMPSLQSLEEIGDTNHVDLLSPEVTEDFAICIDDNGILSLDCYSQYEEIEEEEASEMISFSEAVEALENGLQIYFEEKPSFYHDIILDDIRLTYYMIWNEEEKLIQAVPVYTFAHLTMDEEGNNLDMYPDQLFVINAIDGSMIDVVENGLLLINSLQ